MYEREEGKQCQYEEVMLIALQADIKVRCEGLGISCVKWQAGSGGDGA